jgi:hypothetical protein
MCKSKYSVSKSLSGVSFGKHGRLPRTSSIYWLHPVVDPPPLLSEPHLWMSALQEVLATSVQGQLEMTKKQGHLCSTYACTPRSQAATHSCIPWLAWKRSYKSPQLRISLRKAATHSTILNEGTDAVETIKTAKVLFQHTDCINTKANQSSI